MKASEIIQTAEAILREPDGAFVHARRAEIQAILNTMYIRENALMMGDMRGDYTITKIEPFSGFDDPCDDWDDNYEDYDY